MEPSAQELGYLRPSLDHHRSLLPQYDKPPSQQPGSPSKPSEESELRSRPSSRRNSIPWKVEILSWIGALCCFVAAVVVLRVLNHRPLPDLQFGITPNAILSLLATFTEALLLVPVSSAIGQVKWLQVSRKRPMLDLRVIDEGSRGAWGSLLLLLRQKGGPIGSFGALVTIVALGISTFFQQSLKYYTIYPHTDDASMPIAQYMNGTGSAPVGNGGSTGGVDTKLLTTPYVALFSPPQTNFTAVATVHCGTGNCTWDSYQTLGICNTCADLTSQLKMTKVHIVTDNAASTAYNTDHWTLPNGFGLNGIQPGELLSRLDFAITNAMLNMTTTSSLANVPTGWDSIAFPNNGSKLMSVFAVGAAPGTIPAQPDANYTEGTMTGNHFATPIAFECLLQMCVRNMRAEFINGSLFETEVSNWTNQSTPLGEQNIILQPPGSSTTFVATGLALEGIRNWLKQFLTGNVTDNQNSGKWALDSVFYSSDTMQAFFSATNSSTTGFPDLMDNLANGLSLSLREISYQPSPVLGKAFSPTSHAVVSWPWLILPAFELVGSLVFLIAVMVETRKRGLVPWTNNILAYFFHGLDERPLGQDVRENQDAMEEKARKLLVEFQPQKDGGSLVIAKP